MSHIPHRVCTAVALTSLLFAFRVNAQDESVTLKKVVIFNSGVGYFEHGGQVEGDTQIEMKFNVKDVNDLLKSLVVQDLGGGTVSTVSYGSRDPITKTLKSFAIDLTENPSLAQLLGQVRGEKVEVEAPNKITGTILGIETRQQKVDKEIVERDVLNLLTEEGLRSISLDSVTHIKLLNEKLDDELRQALKILAIGHSTDKKTVSLGFSGAGEREVKIGYIREAPIWKTSYRLVLDDEDKPFLQGWAIVENTSDDDWSDVKLTLVSGRPISFTMDLYQPLYVPRPEVVPELFASLAPQTYGQDVAEVRKEFEALAKKRPADRARLRRAADAFEKAQMERTLAARSRAITTADERLVDGMQLGQTARSIAETGDVGELFHYTIATPVSLARQRSAMLPIVNEEVEGTKVSIYNQSVHAKHPLNGLELTNATELHLLQGPITVFDEGAYAGDAQIEDLPPGGKRLISYAMDLDTEVAPTSKAAPRSLVSVRINRGTLFAQYKHQRTQSYVVKNSGKQEKKVLIEYPKDTSWTLLEPKSPTETTRDRYRFAVAAEPGVPANLKIEEERTIRETVAVNNLGSDAIGFYLSAKVVSKKVKEALQEVVKRKADIARLATEKRNLEAQLNVIDQEQKRIRENMKQLERNSDLYNRYVKKFAEQEDKVEELRDKVRAIEKERRDKQEALNEYLTKLTIE